MIAALISFSQEKNTTARTILVPLYAGYNIDRAKDIGSNAAAIRKSRSAEKETAP